MFAEASAQLASSQRVAVAAAAIHPPCGVEIGKTEFFSTSEDKNGSKNNAGFSKSLHLEVCT